MIYLYYFDGKLTNSPSKMLSSCDYIKQLNKWKYKIDATNGYSSCKTRLLKLIERADKDRDYHILTNSYSLANWAKSSKETGVQCVHTYNGSNWVMVYSATVELGMNWGEL